MACSPGGICHLVIELGTSRLRVGTDVPYPWTTTAMGFILSTPGLSDADRIATLGGTAMAFLGIKA